MKTAKDYKNSMMWNGGNTILDKIDWLLTERNKEILSLIDEMIEKSYKEEKENIEKLKLSRTMEDVDYIKDTELYYRMGLTELKNRLALLSMPASGVLLNNTEGEPTIKEDL